MEVSQAGQCKRVTVNSERQTGQRVGAAYIKNLLKINHTSLRRLIIKLLITLGDQTLWVWSISKNIIGKIFILSRHLSILLSAIPDNSKILNKTSIKVILNKNS